jgi:hypothetical protein
MHPDFLLTAIEYIWVPLVTVVAALWSKYSSVNLRTRLLEQSDQWHKTARLAETKLRDEQRVEIMNRMEAHHDTVMHKLDALSSENGRH